MPDDAPASSPAAPPGPAPLLPGRAALWLIGTLLVAGGLGAAAAIVSRHWAPILVFPLLVGFLLGMVAGGLARVSQYGHRLALGAGLCLAAAALLGVWHYTSYRVHTAALADVDERDPDRARVRELLGGEAQPESFVAFLEQQAARGRPIFKQTTATGVWAWVSWALDGLLIAGAAIVAAKLTLRTPYSDKLKVWYRPVRAAPLPPRVFDKLREQHGWQRRTPSKARFVLFATPSGVGPALLRIHCEQPFAGELEQWLSTDERRTFEKWIDHLSS